jgi:hypothetical protein
MTEPVPGKSLSRALLAGAAVALVVAVAAVLLLAGAPATTDDSGADAQRRADLQSLAAVISRHFEETGMLPARLGALVDERRLESLPKDPASGADYAYEPEVDDSYTLCASFDRTSLEGEAEEFWMHEAGRSCFRMTPAYGEY